LREDEIRKLKALLKHWAEHSLEHRESIMKWARKAEEMGLEKASLYLLRAADAMEEAAKYLEKAYSEI